MLDVSRRMHRAIRHATRGAKADKAAFPHGIEIPAFFRASRARAFRTEPELGISPLSQTVAQFRFWLVRQFYLLITR
jgi:hypothetical protein